MRANPLQGPLEAMGAENQDFFGPETATIEESALWAQKVEILGPTSSNGLNNGFAPIKILSSSAIKIQVLW